MCEYFMNCSKLLDSKQHIIYYGGRQTKLHRKRNGKKSILFVILSSFLAGFHSKVLQVPILCMLLCVNHGNRPFAPKKNLLKIFIKCSLVSFGISMAYDTWQICVHFHFWLGCLCELKNLSFLSYFLVCVRVLCMTEAVLQKAPHRGETKWECVPTFPWFRLGVMEILVFQLWQPK